MDFDPLIFSREGENRCQGKVHGLVGCENDEVRAMKMTYDACDFFGAPSIMKIVQGQAKEYADIIAVDSERYEDNRDFSVWNFVIRIERTREANGLWRTSEKMIKDSLVRGYVHFNSVGAVIQNILSSHDTSRSCMVPFFDHMIDVMNKHEEETTEEVV